MEGQEQTVECDAKGAPKPVVTWYKNGQQLKKTQCTKDPDSCQDIVYEVFEVGETSPNFTSSTYGRLKIVSALYQRDQGEFKCVASNGNLPPAELIFNLDVTGMCSIITLILEVSDFRSWFEVLDKALKSSCYPRKKIQDTFHIISLHPGA